VNNYLRSLAAKGKAYKEGRSWHAEGAQSGDDS
jgi:hypothetical protein